MFGSKSAGVVEKLVDTLPFALPRGTRAQFRAPAIAPEVPGMTKTNETYIAPTQFTVVSMPFFRWNQ